MSMSPEELSACIQSMLRRAKRYPSWFMWAALMATEFLLGARITEVLMLRRRNFVDENNKMYPVITRRKLKTNKKDPTISVRIDPECDLAKVILLWLDYQRKHFKKFQPESLVFSWGDEAKPIWRTSSNRAFQKVYKELGLNYVSRGNHAIRKTAGDVRIDLYQIETGSELMSARALKNFYGHASIATTERYMKRLGGETAAVAMKHSNAIKIGDIL